MGALVNFWGKKHIDIDPHSKYLIIMVIPINLLLFGFWLQILGTEESFIKEADMVSYYVSVEKLKI